MPNDYYDMKKHIYKLRYEENKIKKLEQAKIPENYYYNYWKNAKWKKKEKDKE